MSNTEGISFKDDVISRLLNENESDFIIDCNEEELPKGDEEEHRIDKVYSFEDFSKVINMDCLGNVEECSGKSPFASMVESMFNVLDDGSLRKKIIRHGTDKVPSYAAVYIHYNSYLELEEVPFDSSFLRSEKPVRFQLGAGVLYKGMEIAIATMSKGERSQFLVEPQLAFGKYGVPPRIPPNATILNVIDLIDFVDCGAALNKDDSEVEKTFADLSGKAVAFINLAKDHFVHNLIPAALENYKKSLQVLKKECRPLTGEEEKQYNELLFRTYLNMIICYNSNKINQPNKVLEVAKEAMVFVGEECRKSAKLFFNLGKAHENKLNYEKASECYKKANKLLPLNPDIQEALIKLETKRKQYYEKEKALYSKALGVTPIEKPDIPEALLHDPTFDLAHLEDLEKQYSSYLEDFAQSKTHQMILPGAGLSNEERYVLRTLSKRLNLVYKENYQEKFFQVIIRHQKDN
ncbi:inactive peptidyl-prolyl cis-trans isomerase FKBP6-like [Cimex lectularius]|uniref:peptidylprolyl isomerase n=1 Tax=Cimex lectularius TaxID=79782 RepID=A0A8I6RFB4_CIMLE|nr:inactive peptidyl-prolyl cis-trans isomerase FKBP6-like [Cimex lectularius]